VRNGSCYKCGKLRRHQRMRLMASLGVGRRQS
jgi:hypothetical protein